MRPARWYTDPLPYDTVRRLSEALGSSEILAAALARRGYAEPEAASLFLSARGELNDPFLFPDMADVCAKIKAYAAAGRKVCVHGDYDVDGITSTALLVLALRETGIEAVPFLPNRFKEGYGIAMSTVERLAGEGVELLITVDCGIGAREQLDRAAELGMESIVIDHHLPVEGLVPRGPVISPLICDYPFKELAGVGLAFKVAQALIGEPGPTGPDGDLPASLQGLLDLAALGTIADVVPLVGENRSLVKRGLIQLARTRRPGLKELMRIAQIEPSRVNAGLVSFRMAPRINAAGRMDDPAPALQLLLAEEKEDAARLAAELDSLNRERQQVENRILAEAEQMIEVGKTGEGETCSHVLSAPGWHEGVIGIVASRLVDLHHRPVIMIAEDTESGLGKGSGRSVSGFDLHRSLHDLQEMLAAYGGHSAACGLTIELERIAEFRGGFDAIAASVLTDADHRPSYYIDALVSGRELTLELAEELSLMEPFGMGNPSIDLLATGARISGGRATRDGRHLQCQVEAGGARSSAIGFGQSFLLEKLGSSPLWDVAFRLERNEFNGSVAPQLNLREFFPLPDQVEAPVGLCASRCDYSCPDRLTGDGFWALAGENGCASDFPGAGFVEHDSRPDDPFQERLVDRRNQGDIAGQIGKVMSGGESILLLVADVARRRRFITASLPLKNSGVSRVLLTSSRCGEAAIRQRTDECRLANGAGGDNGQTLALTDFATACANPGLAAAFDHLVFVDPPLSEGMLYGLAAASPDAWVHLFYCADEVQFTGKVLEHEYDLRTPLTKIYKHLKTEKTWPLDGSTERLLLAGGKYLRQPQMVARCLRVLRELDLIAIEENGDRPILTLLEAGKTSLDRSSIYNQSQAFYEGCLKYLSKSLNAKMI